MPRYQINVGDEFPLGEQHRGDCGWNARRRPFGRGKLLKVLFFLSLVAITVSHPVPAALVLGMLLLIHRSGWLHEAHARWHRGETRARGWNRQQHWHGGGGEPGAFV